MLMGDVRGATIATYQTIFDAAPFGIIVVERGTGLILLSNRKADTMFGYPGWGLYGKSIDDLVPSAAGDHFAYRKGFEGNPSPRPMAGRKTLKGKRADGSLLDVLVELSPTPMVINEERSFVTVAYVQEAG